MSHTNRIQSTRSGVTAAPMPRSNITWINMGLALMALGLLIYYVAQINLLASRTWQMKALQDKISVLHQERNDLVARQGEFDDREVLEQLATTEGLVPAGVVVYLVQDTEVAAR